MDDGSRMSAAPGAATGSNLDKFRARIHRLAASRRFQSWAARMPLLRRKVAREGVGMFDLVAGFVHSQTLLALVELRVLPMVAEAPQTVSHLATICDVPPERMAVLLQAGAAIGLLRRCRDGRFGLSLRGAAFLGVPGLDGMVRHHRVLYADLSDPVAFFRGQTTPGLARFWPYVFGAGAAADPALSAQYSRLMTESQSLVAEDTLRLVNLSGTRRLVDVGGGTGAFLAAVAAAHPQIELVLFDLPAVVAQARPGPRLVLHPGSFRDDPLPQGADAISLVRVLYDHADATVAALLAKVHDALSPGGRVIISEPMSGGDVPDRATDGYFALYTLAMETGRTRSAAEISAALLAAGFNDIRLHPGTRPYVTSAVTARRPQ